MLLCTYPGAFARSDRICFSALQDALASGTKSPIVVHHTMTNNKNYYISYALFHLDLSTKRMDVPVLKKDMLGKRNTVL
jgi:hypothetical protein